jgi:hypothetical protein
MSSLSSVVPHFLLSVVTPGAVAAVVTALIQRKRADLQLIKINETRSVADWLARASTDPDPEAKKAMQNWQPRDIVLLTNCGNGTAYDIRLSGSDCRPRVWVLDTASRAVEENGPGPAAVLPMWSSRYPALEPGGKWSLVVMSSTDETRKPPVLEVSWRGLFRRKKVPLNLANADTIETGWPGKTKTKADAS